MDRFSKTKLSNKNKERVGFFLFYEVPTKKNSPA